MTRIRKKVVVALSGSRSSAVTLLLLKNQGYDVRAVHLTFTPRPQTSLARFITFGSSERLTKLCSKYEIPLEIRDASEIYDTEVFEAMLHARLGGRSFNPYFQFLSRVLFPKLCQVLVRHPGALLATGHAAKVHDGLLYRSQDRDADESAWIGGLSSVFLQNLFLPLGELSSAMIATLTTELGIADLFPSSGKCYSPTTCFDPEYFASEDFKSFISPTIGLPGAILSMDDFSLAAHTGIHQFERGQALTQFPNQFVIEIRPGSRNVMIGPPDFLNQSSFTVRGLQWQGPHSELRVISGEAELPGEGSLGKAFLTPYEASYAQIELERPSPLVSPGKPLIFYHENQVLGGGEIHSIKAMESALSKKAP